MAVFVWDVVFWIIIIVVLFFCWSGIRMLIPKIKNPKIQKKASQICDATMIKAIDNSAVKLDEASKNLANELENNRRKKYP